MPRPSAVLLVASLLLGGQSMANVALASADPTGNPVPEVESSTGRVAATDDPSVVQSRPLAIDTWSRTETNDVLSVHFSLGSPDCTGVHAEVSESPDAVTVGLHEGRHPWAVGRMCTMLVVPATLDVVLRAPLGDRTVLSSY